MKDLGRIAETDIDGLIIETARRYLEQLDQVSSRISKLEKALKSEANHSGRSERHCHGNPDVLIVIRLDRLARSTRDLLNIVAAIAGKQAGFRSLGDTWADTTTPHGRLMLTVLGGLAEFERELLRARTGEGRERAKARGVKMGRPFKLTPHQQREAIRRRDSGEETLADIGRSYNMSGSTISRLAL